MIKEVILFIKYPYTAGVIAAIWLGSAILMGLNSDLPLVRMVVINAIATIVIAQIGFSGSEKR